MASNEPISRVTGFVKSDGEQIYYESLGVGAVAIVFSHGYGGNHAIWYQQAAVFARAFRVITWDHRGFGRSTNVADASGPVAAARDLKALLNGLEIERAHLVGQSMGGWSVMGFAIENPGRTLSMVLADTIGGIYNDKIRDAYDEFIERARGAAAAPRKDSVGRHPAIGDWFSESNLAGAFLYQQIGSTSVPPPPIIPAKLRATAYDHAALAKLTMPILFIVGAQDLIFPPSSIREAASLVPNSRVVEIPLAGHSPYFETPESWNETVLAFFKSLEE